MKPSCFSPEGLKCRAVLNETRESKDQAMEAAVAMTRNKQTCSATTTYRFSSAHIAGGVVPQSKALSQR